MTKSAAQLLYGPVLFFVFCDRILNILCIFCRNTLELSPTFCAPLPLFFSLMRLETDTETQGYF